MGSIDINILTGIPDYMIYNGKKIEFRAITLEEYVFICTDIIEVFKTEDFEYEKKEKMLDDLSVRIFNINKPLVGFTETHLIHVKDHFAWLDYKHQGFTKEQYIELTNKRQSIQKYNVDFIYFLHKLSETKGWTHEYMMSMDKRLFYRYYGYTYQDTLREVEAQEEYEKKEERKQSMNNLRQQAGIQTQ